MLSIARSKLLINVPRTSRGICISGINLIRTTPILCAEPLKKKKKMDPQIIRQREERRKKKLEKQIRRLEKNTRQLKPIDELEVPLELIDEKKQRSRLSIQITNEELQKRVAMQKKWALYRLNEKVADFHIIDKLYQSQQKALDELKKESEELYREAIQPDLKLIPYTIHGPVATPPIEKYESPDGEYIDISRKWE